jgi:translation initiation factor 1 (eIF-1/SUI1)
MKIDMPKQKIEVNENLNISIGEFLKIKVPENSPSAKTAEEAEHLGEVLNDKTSEKSISSKDATPSINKPDSDIKKMIPKIGKISLQHQKSGRGGKTVTLVYVSGETVNLEALLKELKKGLGCGGQIEGGKIVLHGGIADRASEWFIKMGAKAVKTS